MPGLECEPYRQPPVWFRAIGVAAESDPLSHPTHAQTNAQTHTETSPKNHPHRGWFSLSWFGLSLPSEKPCFQGHYWVAEKVA